MGAVPKNKITRVERGKRRRGNRPDLTKDPKLINPPLHKRGLVAAMFRAVGLQLKPNSSQVKKSTKAAKS